MTLDENVNLHSKDYGWVLEDVDHTEIDRLSESWQKDMDNWLQEQSKAGKSHISKADLDDQIGKMKSKWGLVNDKGVPIKGKQAVGDWKGRSNYYSKIRKKHGGNWGKAVVKEIVDEAGEKVAKSALKKGVKYFITIAVPGAAVLVFTAEVKANGVIVGTLNTVSPIDVELAKEVTDAAVE